MNKMIKGTLVMTNVANKDIDMYIKCGWKLEKKQNRSTKSKKTIIKDKLQEDNVENSIECNTVEE